MSAGRKPGLAQAGLRQVGDPGASGGGGGGGEGGTVTAADITDATAAGRNMLKAAGVSAQKALLSLGSMSAQSADAVAITGGTVTGLGMPTDPTDASSKAYVDAMTMVDGLPFGSMATQNADAVDITGGTITGLSAPTVGSDAATKDYADSVVGVLAAIATSGLAADITDATVAGRDMLKAASVAAQKTLLSLAAIATSGLAADITDATADGRNMLKAASVAAQKTLLGLAAIATSGLAADITDATADGRNMLKAASIAAQKTLLGLAAIATSGLAADITDATADGRNMLKAASVAAQKTLLGLAAIASSGLASDLTGTIGLANGGTGQTTALAAADALSPQGANIAGASTTDLSTVTGPVVTITGTGASITSFGSAAAGVRRRITFASGGSAIIHNGSTNILPFAASIVVTAGDTFEMTSLGSSSWRMTGYLPVTAGFWRTALGLANMASNPISNNITDSTSFGRSVITGGATSVTALLDLATTSLAGLLSAADKTKLNGLATLATTPTAANITDATSFGRALLTAASVAAQQTALALGTLATAVISGTANARVEAPEQLDRQVLSGATSFTTATFTANAYKKIILKYKGVRGAADMLFRLKFNNDTGTNYADIGYVVNNGSGTDTSASGTNGYATIAQCFAQSDAVCEWIMEIDPRNDGLYRVGHGRAVTMCIGVAGWIQERFQTLAWLDKTTDVTFFTIFTQTSTLVGTFEMYGVRA